MSDWNARVLRSFAGSFRSGQLEVVKALLAGPGLEEVAGCHSSDDEILVVYLLCRRMWILSEAGHVGCSQAGL